MRFWLTGLVGLAFVLLSLACESQVGTGLIHYDKSGKWESERVMERATPVVHLVIVDDAPSAAATSLRDQIGVECEDLYDRLDGANCGIIADPAYFRAVDTQMIVVGASRPGKGLHAGNTPGLLFRAANASKQAQGQWAQAVKDAMAQVETIEAESPRVIDALEYWLALLGGHRPATNNEEERLIDALDAQPWLHVSIAVTRPDESLSQVERVLVSDFAMEFLEGSESSKSYVRGGSSIYGLIDYGLSPSCWTTREEAFATLPRLAPVIEYWESTSCPYSGLLGPHGVADCGPYWCMGEPLRLESGGVKCTILTRAVPNFECGQRPGWRDPIGKNGVPEPRFEDGDEGRVRVCEIVQLEGEALQSCRKDLDCSSCEPGWCLREAWSDEYYDWSAGTCRYEEGLPSLGLFRFTQGSNQGEGLLQISCQLGDIIPEPPSNDQRGPG